MEHAVRAGGWVFFPDWEDYLNDIKYLVDAHQEKSTQASQHDQRHLEQCRLDEERLEGPLRYLMKMADMADNSHSGDFASHDEKHVRSKLVQYLNAALNMAAYPRRYRFIGHRLAELRGIETNIIHNCIVEHLQETYGKEVCIDLLYHPEGVDYLLDYTLPFTWSAVEQRTLARKIAQKFAWLQSEQLGQFIKAKPSGISVDDAAMQSGASLEQIFTHITNIVKRKRYKLEWLEERNTYMRKDLEAVLTAPEADASLKERVVVLLQEAQLIPTDGKKLELGEFAMAYRNFLKDHREAHLKALKQDAWQRVARLFQLPVEHDPLYNLVNPYRRGYFMARDLPDSPLEEMLEQALADLAQVDEEFVAVQATGKGKKQTKQTSIQDEQESEENAQALAQTATYLVDYLERNLHVWDSLAPLNIESINFIDSLRRYVDQKRLKAQCCYCGSPLQAEEWMALQVPPSIGVQSFSNRLEAGSSREPKRNVCDVCRAQFILEKLAWRSHRDKQGNDQLTFYMHLFPYSFFTQPMLLAWRESIERLRNGDHTALFLDTGTYFQKWQEEYVGFQVDVRFSYRGLQGMSIPTFAETMSNTPVLPFVLEGNGYGQKFLKALEQAVLIALWFDCRVLFSRLPTPLLNLANERVDEQPVALLVENTPQVLSWLLPRNTLTREDLTKLCHILRDLHQVAALLLTKEEDRYPLIYDLLVAASTDPLALYHEVDRRIERQVGARRSKNPEHLAITLSQQVAPLLHALLEGEKV